MGCDMRAWLWLYLPGSVGRGSVPCWGERTGRGWLSVFICSSPLMGDIILDLCFLVVTSPPCRRALWEGTSPPCDGFPVPAAGFPGTPDKLGTMSSCSGLSFECLLVLEFIPTFVPLVAAEWHSVGIRHTRYTVTHIWNILNTWCRLMVAGVQNLFSKSNKLARILESNMTQWTVQICSYKSNCKCVVWEDVDNIPITSV